MKSYQLLSQPRQKDAALIRQLCSRLDFLGFSVVSVQPGRTPSITVRPNAATRLLESVYTGQGWEQGRMYKSYAAVVDGVKVVWHKPMRAPSASKVIRWPGRCYRRAAG